MEKHKKSDDGGGLLQVERKRHIGNDIVNIIFMDEASVEETTHFQPQYIKTHFTHIYAVVCYQVNPPHSSWESLTFHSLSYITLTNVYFPSGWCFH